MTVRRSRISIVQIIGYGKVRNHTEIGCHCARVDTEFKGETSWVQREVVSTQQAEIQSLSNEIKHLRLKQELSMQNMEISSAVQYSGIENNIVGL